MRLLAYRSHQALKISDHKPVSALFDVDVGGRNWKDLVLGCFAGVLNCNSIFIYKAAMARRRQRDLSVFESSYHLPSRLPLTLKALHCPFILLNVKQGSCEYQFSSLLFDPTGNRTCFCSVNSWRYIHSNTDRYKVHCNLKQEARAASL